MFKLWLLFVGILNLFTLTVYADNIPTQTFSLHTNAFRDKGTLPAIYTCDGKDQSPALSWSNAPAKTATFTLIMRDPDAPSGTFYHWVLYNIPATVTALPKFMNALPATMMAGKNSWGRAKYNGPCPPVGTTHHYIFTLYALDARLNLPTGANIKAISDSMQKHILGKAELSATYGH